ncbi:MAG: response regulator transcription factor [Armatimonadota bacterium]|nr:response regulator transcription factor [Armatimonadota bacterium]
MTPSTTEASVLIAEDDIAVAQFLRQAMMEAGFAVKVAHDGLSTYDLAKKREFGIILLDVMLPGLSGIDVCRKLRASEVTTPILMITARDMLADKIRGLDSGADDYIVKPFQIGELLARVRAVLRRGTGSPTILKVADLLLDPSSHQVSRAGKQISLSATEFSLLEYLMRNAGAVLTRSMILDHVWQYEHEGGDNILGVYISYLRGKIDRGFSRPLIHTVRGIGYRIHGGYGP